MNVSDVWLSTLEFAYYAGHRDLDRIPGCFETTLGDWRLTMNPHTEDAQSSTGQWVGSMRVLVEYGGTGQIVGLVNQEGGLFVGDHLEGQLLEQLHAAIAYLKGLQEAVACGSDPNLTMRLA